MSDLTVLLVFGVFYPLVALLVLCAGAFATATGLPEIRNEANEYGRRQYLSKEYQFVSANWYVRRAVTGRLCLSLFAGVVWPLAIPVWLAWRKGTFVADALEKREAALKELK